MSEDRKKVSLEQLQILVEALEKDRSLMPKRLPGRSAALKLAHYAKWEALAKKLNSVDNGGLKNVTKWQQSLRDFKNNTKKKAAKNQLGDTPQEFSTLELRLLALFNEEGLENKPVGIDISCVAEIDPLSSDENNSCDNAVYPETYSTYTCDIKAERSPSPEESLDYKYKIKRRRVHMVSEDVISQQNNLLNQLTELTASRQELEKCQASTLEALSSALQDHASAATRIAAAAEAQTEVMKKMLEVLQKMDRND